jgi:Fur family iron response transcriptional regulator
VLTRAEPCAMEKYRAHSIVGCREKRKSSKVFGSSSPLSGRGRQTSEMDGCPVHALRKRLRAASLRPTRQRVTLGWLLFGKGDRHVTADMLFDEARTAKAPVSMATIYNTLHQFTRAGLLREIVVEGSRAYFDTNPLPHAHFLLEETGTLVDIPAGDLELIQPPKAPDGYEIDRVEMIVRVRAVSKVQPRPL